MKTQNQGPQYVREVEEESSEYRTDPSAEHRLRVQSSRVARLSCPSHFEERIRHQNAHWQLLHIEQLHDRLDAYT